MRTPVVLIRGTQSSGTARMKSTLTTRAQVERKPFATNSPPTKMLASIVSTTPMPAFPKIATGIACRKV